MDTERLISLAKALSKPYIIVATILGILLFASVSGNVYQATQKTEIVVEQDYDASNYNTNQVS